MEAVLYFKSFVMNALLIGNGIVKNTPDFKKYDQVVMFNKLFHKEYIKFMTQHWIRFYDRFSFHGMDLIPKHRAKVVLVTPSGDYENEIKYFHDKYNRETSACRIDFNDHLWYETCGGKFYVSTGAACIKQFLDGGYNISLSGFTFQGAKMHNWAFEERFAKNNERILII